MSSVERRAFLISAFGLGALSGMAGCNNSDVMPPPDQRRANAPKSEPPKGMKPQENFDPRKRLREQAGK